MNTKVIFNTDSKLKTALSKKARANGMTVSAVLNIAARAYVSDRVSIDAVDARLAESLGDVRHGRVLTAAEMRRRLAL